ncbi:MaoC family dehydratase [Amycolatopsis jiangsuensis]|uniref:Acyl dehydratase n=1 Tax=Amycolatopsis jiangsuensis TaxID=1181879 RepID=A0A840J4J7_9PSEU|nr:MaoC family dehydratase [Amycolatopsis jiangsuensis]MBB4688649.1 acyl dehydratase [Amycolatopsis jiangsuensis]
MTEFTTPIGDRWFEDYPLGAVYEFGDVTVTEAEIVEFARRFDPQSFHVDPVVAKSGPFGGLIASGWHTASLMMRMFADHYLSSVASLGSPGMDELRWPRPVRPGDRLHMRATVTEARLSKSKPDRGLVRTRMEVFTADDELVLSGSAVNFLSVRPATSR